MLSVSICDTQEAEGWAGDMGTLSCVLPPFKRQIAQVNGWLKTQIGILLPALLLPHFSPRGEDYRVWQPCIPVEITLQMGVWMLLYQCQWSSQGGRDMEQPVLQHGLGSIVSLGGREGPTCPAWLPAPALCSSTMLAQAAAALGAPLGCGRVCPCR